MMPTPAFRFLARLARLAKPWLAAAALTWGMSSTQAQGTPGICLPKGQDVRAVTAADFLNSGLKGFHLGGVPRAQLFDWDFKDLKSTGAKVVRAAVRLQRCKGCSTYGISEEDLLYTDQVVKAGERLGFCTIITFMPQHPWDKPDYWDSEEMLSSMIDAWGRVATRYKGSRHVVGYDLINEPAPAYHGDRIGQWMALATRMGTRIRAIDPEKVIIMDGLGQPRVGYFEGLKPLPLGNVVYSFHFYQPHELTHQRLPGVSSEVRGYPGQGIDKAWLSQRLEPYRAFARAYKVPIYVGEFGIVRWATPGSRTQYVKDFVALIEAEGWSWTYHAFREFHGWDAELPEGEREFHRDNPAGRSLNTPTMTFLRNRMASPSK